MRRIVLAVVGMVLAAAESAATESLSAAASPAADLVVAFDTLQAEKAMDANLWKRIQSDKKRALQRSRDKSPFKTEGRDIAGTVNVSFISFSPFRFIADGVLCVSGGKGTSMREDVAMLADMAKDSGFEVSMSGGKKTPTYSFDMKAVPDDDGDEIMPGGSQDLEERTCRKGRRSASGRGAGGNAALRFRIGVGGQRRVSGGTSIGRERGAKGVEGTARAA